MNGRWTEADVARMQPQVEAWTAEETLRWVAAEFARPVFATSMGLEDQAILHAIVAAKLAIPAFTLDTGRLPPETYDLIAETEARLGVRIEVRFPDAADVESMVALHGIALYRTSVELRKHCCEIRKVRPLGRALAGADAWVCGLRRGQAATRGDVRKLEWDAAHGIPKVNPLADWTLPEVEDYMRRHGVPRNPLHDRGYPSIGCACCTRAVRDGEDIRAGRWWWETPEHKECGLHPGRPGQPKEVHHA